MMDTFRSRSEEADRYVPWMESNSDLIGPLIKPGSDDWHLAGAIPCTWRDLFVSDVREMPPTY